MNSLFLLVSLITSLELRLQPLAFVATSWSVTKVVSFIIYIAHLIAMEELSVLVQC